MTAVVVAILHPEAGSDAGPLERAVTSARSALAERHRRRFVEAGVGDADAWIVAGKPDGVPFGTRLGAIVDRLPAEAGLVILGSGAVPLLRPQDYRAFVAAAAGGARGTALANSRFSADIVAIPDARVALAGAAGSITDNALPRWLAETAGRAVADLSGRWRLGIDIDGPLDLVLLGHRWAAPLPPAARDRIATHRAALRAVAHDPSAELVVAGRTSAASLRWLERSIPARTRALVEERGLRTRRPGQRPAASVLGALLDRDGPSSLGVHLARLGDAAVIDSRVLLAHRLGADERRWPCAEDRFASDLLDHPAIADPWLRDLTRAAEEAPIPVLLGGHTLVGPGLRLAIGR